MSRGIEALSERNSRKIQDLDRPQKPRVLYESAKVKQETSKMGLVPIQI